MRHQMLLDNKKKTGPTPAQRVHPAVQNSFDMPVHPGYRTDVRGHDFSRIAVLAGSGAARPHKGGGATSAEAAEASTEAATPDASKPAEATEAAKETPEAEAARTSESNAPPETAAATVAPPSLSWEHTKRSAHDALWWFNGEHPRWFSTTATLTASGYGDPLGLNWRIVRGADKVAFDGATTGPAVMVRSTGGSRRADDVEIEVSEGTGATAVIYTGKLTVRMPNRLIQRSVNDSGSLGPLGAPAGSPGFWTTIDYRIVDNVGGTIVGATVNENFPGSKTNDQPNNWPSSATFATTPSWPNTSGTFIDNWFVWGGYTPTPVAPTAANASQSVDRMAHEFYVGSTVPGRGVRVQTHTAHRYLGHARHESITTPAP